MVHTPSLTAQGLTQYLLDSGTCTPVTLASLLGAKRHAVTVNTLELALAKAGVCNEAELGAMVSAVAGPNVTVFTGPLEAASSALPARVALTHGAFLLADPDTITVAFVEDTETNVAAVAAALGRDDFTIVLTTALTFTWVAQALYQNDTSQVPNAVAGTLFDVLDAGLDIGASDIHLAVGSPPAVRTSGSIALLDFDRLTKTWMVEQADMLMEPRHKEELERTFSCDLAYTFGDVRYRVNIANDTLGLTMALRRLPSVIPAADELGIPPLVRILARRERGLFLVTGPTGSGKTTTLASLLAELCDEARHLITLEDPVEFVLPHDKAARVNQRELGASFPSFPEGLRDALRQDPDIVFVGELRDTETMETAFTAAETGHMVFATVHTHDAASTVMRLVNSFPEGTRSAVRVQLSQLLQCVVSQTLLPRSGGKGRIAAYEVLANTTAVAANLRKEDGHNRLKDEMLAGSTEGMQLMEAALAKLVIAGAVSKADAEFKARDHKEFHRLLAYYSSQAAATRGRGASAPLLDE